MKPTIQHDSHVQNSNSLSKDSICSEASLHPPRSLPESAFIEAGNVLAASIDCTASMPELKFHDIDSKSVNAGFATSRSSSRGEFSIVVTRTVLSRKKCDKNKRRNMGNVESGSRDRSSSVFHQLAMSEPPPSSERSLRRRRNRGRGQ